MAGWMALAGQGVKLISDLTKKKERGQEAPGFHETGFDNDVRPMSPKEPATDVEGPKSFREKVNQGMGSNIGKAATQIAGQFVNDAMTRRATKKQWKHLESKGLTAWEIGSGGSGGGTVRSQGNTLGSGPATQIKSQQEFTANQAALERQNRLDVVEAQKEVPRRAEGRAGDLHRGAMIKQTEQIGLLERQIAKLDFEVNNAWALKFAGMGVDNMKAAVISKMNGLDVEKILKGTGANTPQQRAKQKAFLLDVAEYTGRSEGFIGIGRMLQEYNRGSRERSREFQKMGNN